MNSADPSISQWIGMTLTVIFVFIRIGSKWSVLRKWKVDDTMIMATMVRPHSLPEAHQTHVNHRYL
jgi:hypothetical protein